MSALTPSPDAPSPGNPGKSCPSSAPCSPVTGTGHEHALPVTAIIPTLNAAADLSRTLGALRGQVAHILVVDGGSKDATRDIAEGAGAAVVTAPCGRGTQLAAGTAEARNPWLLFLHADTVPGAGWQPAAARFMADPANQSRAAYFRFALDDPAPEARRLERWVSRRCRWLALPYGDQGLLIHRDLLACVGGFRPLPLMEDVDLIRRLGRKRLVGLDIPFVTSAARWRRDGWGRRSRRNLACLALWFLGVSPERIAKLYGRG